jgi:hypothetical protein
MVYPHAAEPSVLSSSPDYMSDACGALPSLSGVLGGGGHLATAQDYDKELRREQRGANCLDCIRARCRTNCKHQDPSKEQPSSVVYPLKDSQCAVQRSSPHASRSS